MSDAQHSATFTATFEALVSGHDVEPKPVRLVRITIDDEST